MNKQAFVALQKIRHEVQVARPEQLTIRENLTVKQAAALVAWIDKKQQEQP